MNLPYDLSKTGRVASLLLLIYCAAEVLFIWHSFTLIGVYNVFESGVLSQVEIEARATSVDNWGAAAAGVLLLALFGCYVASGMWTYRAAANAQAVTPDPERITPGWAVGWYFVPIANLWMPYRAIRQAWNGLHGVRHTMAAMPQWTLVWWLVWLLSNSFATAAARFSTNANTLDQFRTAAQLDIASSSLAILAAWLFRKLILDLTQASDGARPYDKSAGPTPYHPQGA